MEEFVKQRIYTKSISITPEMLKKIDEIRGRKSKAGKLNEIIEFYLLSNKVWSQFILTAHVVRVIRAEDVEAER